MISPLDRACALGIASVSLGLALVACGAAKDLGQAANPTTAAEGTPSPTVKSTAKSRSDNRPSKARLIKRIKAELGSGVPSKVVTCMADVVLMYGRKADVQRYIAGAIDSIDRIKMSDEKAVEKAGWRCTELA